MSRPYFASDDPGKFSGQLDRLNDRPYSKTIASAIRPLGRQINELPANDDQILKRIQETIDCFGGDPELAIHYLMVVLDSLLERGRNDSE